MTTGPTSKTKLSAEASAATVELGWAPLRPVNAGLEESKKG